jgi:outer membrane protein OmpA-like peptidoglycan-associated protein
MKEVLLSTRFTKMSLFITILFAFGLLADKKSVRFLDLSGNPLAAGIDFQGQNILIASTNSSFMLDLSDFPQLKKKEHVEIFLNNRICYSGKIPQSGKLVCLFGVLCLDYDSYRQEKLEKKDNVDYPPTGKKNVEQIMSYDKSVPADNENQLSGQPRTNYIDFERKDEGLTSEAARDSMIMVVQDEKSDFIEIPDLLFDFNKATLSVEAQKDLEVLQGYFQKPYKKIIVRGYTDDLGKREYNQKLSRERASAVVSYLHHQFNIREALMDVVGLGASDPVADNSSPEGRKRNRRVTIEILK